MNDDKRKPPRDNTGRGKPRDGERAPFRKAEDGDRKPFKKREDGAARPFRAREDGASKPFQPRDGASKPYQPRPEGDRKPPFKKREDGAARPFRAREDGDRKPFQPRDGASKPYQPRPEGDRKPYQKREDGAARPFRAREDGDRKPFQARDGASKPYQPRPEGDRKPYQKREDGDRKPFQSRDGASKPYQLRPEGDRKPYQKREDGAARPFRAREDGDRKPYQPRPEGDRKPYQKREDGDRKPFQARDGASKPYQPRPESHHKPHQKRDDGAARPGRRERDIETAPVSNEDGERIARRLARVGIASRRDAEDIIAEGRVRLNGKVLSSPAVNVGPNDRIEVDDQLIPAVERTRLFLFHKPAGVVTTNRDPEGRTTVFDVLPKGLPRLMTIGRLDINTEGLLLLTNDGGLSRVLELPTTGWLRRYRVRVHGKVEQSALDGLKEGIAVDGVLYGPIEASLDREQGSNAWLTIGLREGKNREVKNILGALGLDVTRLIRVSFGPFQLGELGDGEVRELKGRLLRDQLGDRLIEESGANFEAPILNEFTNEAISAVKQVAEEERSDFRPNRKREREDKREDALGRLQTKPKHGDGNAPRPGPKRDGSASKWESSGPKRDGGAPKWESKGPKRDGDAPKWESKGPKRDGGAPKWESKGPKRDGGAPKWESKGPKREGGGKFGEREERPVEKPRPRNANVWMAPGARPLGEKKAAAMAERNEGRRYAGKPRPAGPAGNHDGGRPGAGPKGPRKPRDRS